MSQVKDFRACSSLWAIYFFMSNSVNTHEEGFFQSLQSEEGPAQASSMPYPTNLFHSISPSCPQ